MLPSPAARRVRLYRSSAPGRKYKGKNGRVAEPASRGGVPWAHNSLRRRGLGSLFELVGFLL